MLSVKAIKEFPGQEGNGVACKVLWHGKHVANYVDYGDGGEGRIDTVDFVGHKAFTVTYPTVNEQIDAIEAAITTVQIEKKAAAKTKQGQLVFRTPEQKVYEFYTIKTTDRTQTMARMRTNYPGAVFFVAMPTGWAWVS